MQVTETVIGGANEKQSQEMSENGLAAVRAVSIARDALNDGYTDQARKLLTEAHELLGKIKAVDQPVTVEKAVKIGDKAVKSEKNTLTPDLIPVMSNLKIIEEFAPTPEKLEAIHKAKGHLGSGERDQAIQVLKAAEIGLATEDISMPLAETNAHVSDAIKLIDEGKFYQANLELKKVEDGLVRESAVLLRPSAPPTASSKPTESKPAESKPSQAKAGK